MESMRDALFNDLFNKAKNDSAIMVLSSDFSAPSFDRWRTDLPGQFVNTGISEQNSILVASGLALSGMKVFVVSIAPFITMRCYEQIRLFPADLRLNVTVVGVGAGFSYTEAGATHHAVEDIGLMRLLPNMRVYSPSDNRQVVSAVDDILRRGGPHYVRLDRRSLPNLYPEDQGFGASLAILSRETRVNFLSTGYMTHVALEMAAVLKADGFPVGVIDAFGLPLDENEFAAVFSGSELIVSLEEHVAVGGLGAAAGSLLERLASKPALRSFALDLRHGLCHTYGPRDLLLKRHGLDREVIMDAVRGFYK
jgi:transketolase